MRPSAERGTAWAVALAASTSFLTACSLGLVDLPPEPAAARLSVVSRLEPDPADPSSVRVLVDALLDPGVGLDGEPRGVAWDVFEVEGTEYTPLPTDGDPPFRRWQATKIFPSPGPEGIGLRLPQISGLALARSISMRVRVETTPLGTLVLEEGEALVLRAEAPSNPAETLDWTLELTSASLPGYRVEQAGDTSWPTELSVPADQIPEAALPVEASLRIRWYRDLDLVELTPVERYELALESHMVATWIVDRAQ